VRASEVLLIARVDNTDASKLQTRRLRLWPGGNGGTVPRIGAMTTRRLTQLAGPVALRPGVSQAGALAAGSAVPKLPASGGIASGLAERRIRSLEMFERMPQGLTIPAQSEMEGSYER
jgi:hypothetical protein